MGFHKYLSLLTITFSVLELYAADVAHIYGGDNYDTYLGCLNCVETNSLSIWNEYGDYGSKYKSTSIWNEYGDFGGAYSKDSPFNQYASNPPMIVDDDGGFYGYLTINEYKVNQADFDLAKFMYLLWEKIPNDVSDYYDLIVSEYLGKYVTVNGMYIFAQDLNEQYLGFITTNEFETESIINEFGSYGSEFSSTSINNEFSTYGSEFSSYSAYNEFSSTPPIIYSYSSVTKQFTASHYLTKNHFKTPYIDPDMLKFFLLERGAIDWSLPVPLSYITTAIENSGLPLKQRAFSYSVQGNTLRLDIGKIVTGSIKLFDLRGRIIQTISINNSSTAEFNVSGFAKGAYLVLFQIDGELIDTKKIMIR